jgi:hypothetical protein
MWRMIMFDMCCAGGDRPRQVGPASPTFKLDRRGRSDQSIRAVAQSQPWKIDLGEMGPVRPRVSLAGEGFALKSPNRQPARGLLRPLVAAALPARNHAAVVPFNPGSYRAAALSWADGDTTGTDANCGVGVVPPATIPIVVAIPVVVAVPPDLNIDTLGNLDALGFGRSDERGSCQHRCGCRHGKSDLHRLGVSSCLI